ncbi:hypothetical protein ACET3Z_032051 [Daucus carota]
MDLAYVLRMNAGNLEGSYAKNSFLQKTVIFKAREVLEDAIKDYGSHGFPECFKLADLGCSSGPNALLIVANIVDYVRALCQKKNLKAPDEYQVFLNDLPNNDFNSLFEMIPSFHSKVLENESGPEKSANCYISGVPGSFYTRLFPTKSLHFVHSSYSVHWLSQVPEKLLDSNKGNIFMAKESPFSVLEAYINQFKSDFTTFLQMRSQEMVSHGRMVLTLLGRSIEDPTSKDCCYIYGLVAKSLHDLLAEGLLREEDINTFNLPIYTPCTSELKAIIKSEGSFSLERLETFEVNWDMQDENEKLKPEYSSGKFVAKTIRAVLEPLLASHFGNTLMDKLFEQYAKHVSNRKCSYAKNSTLQKTAIFKARDVLEDAIKDYGSHGFPECFKLADLGCSSGPNALLLVANIVDSVRALCQKKNLKAPDEYQVFLNDLPKNDFNSLFEMIPSFHSKVLENESGPEKSANCYISGVPGSFYTRLFPTKSLHFVHSSSSVHWLSQVPKTLLDSNKGNIFMAKESPSSVLEAYINQFESDFTTFLQMRSQEMVCHGRMVLTLLGRSIEDPTSKDCCYISGLVAKSLHDLLAEGLLREEDINTFNLPIYTPCTSELKAIIKSEGSFSLNRLETFEVNWDMQDENEELKPEYSSGEFVAKTTRAALEPLLASHFGNILMDKLFVQYAKHVSDHLSKEKTNYFNIVVSLTRK